MNPLLVGQIAQQFRSRLRNRAQVLLIFLPPALLGLLIGMADSPRSPAATLFVLVLSVLWCSGFACIREIVDERAAFRQEKHVPILFYALAKCSWAIALSLTQGLIFTFTTAAVLPSLPFPILDAFWLFSLTAAAGAGLSLFISAVVTTPGAALTLFPLVLVPQFLFGGFIIPTARLRPFVEEAGSIRQVREDLVRPPGSAPVLLLSNLSAARWAWEAGGSILLLQQPVGTPDQMREEAKTLVRLAVLVPFSVAEDPAEALLEFQRVVEATLAHPGTPPSIHITDYRIHYALRLLYCILAEGALMLICLAWRDPRSREAANS